MISGLTIKRLIATGFNCEDAYVDFRTNAHSIIGPSNTGKSYVFQCIKYLFGTSKKPKKIGQSYGYDDCYLEIILPDKSINTLHRSLSGGDALLYECKHSEIVNYAPKPEMLIIGRKETKKNRTLNDFFLALLNLKDKKVRRNKGGVTNDFSFSFLRHFSLIDEIAIITEDSPVYTGQHGEKPKEESILRVLLTGEDDKNISSKPKQKIIDNRKGRMDVLNELIVDYEKELSEFNEISINKEMLEIQIEKLGVSILLDNEKLKLSYERLDVYETTINEFWTKWKETESRLIAVNELLSRLELLDEHYESDLSRLESLQEASLVYTNLDVGTCPICNSEYAQENHETCSSSDIEDVLVASNAEIAKIYSLKSELRKTRENLSFEKEELLVEIESSKLQHNNAQKSKLKFISEFIKSTVNNLDLLRLTLRDRKQALRIVTKINDLLEQKENYEVEIDPMDGDYDFDELTTSITTSFCEVVEGLLNEWGYSEETSVSFSEETCDLVIDGYDRNLAGKGYRALSYSAFCIGLMHTCLKNNLPHSGFVLLDSPLCTLRSRHVKNSTNVENKDIISDKTKEAFYTSIAKYKGLGQIIVLDNDGPSNPELIGIGYTEFTEDKSYGRYGFFIPKDNSLTT